ncbi:BrnT family toxin [Oligoflexia bacterium]|nr:BrnT family toxin [Oligoflexia bacterium]
MVFTWDVQKAIANFEKHGVSFEEAATAFTDYDGLHIDDVEHSQEEPRFFRIGKSCEDRILTIVFTVRMLSDGKETIRIISARQASKKEREAYTRLSD